ncbi:terminase small subunit [Deefgea tanakiae]|uniref:Terminase small subunit n=1 Tax=Deefgea tanakiae TaxID=2865840 RepID=A0ABX8Z423_9NEIS|nr:terminase small subunit [Deefgea tanakiae]QZA77042.1 terminase small subunit [Deefgea tanakiae]
MPKAKSLTQKQQAFVAEYMIDLNATQAAIRAGYSAKTAYSIGYELLIKPEVQTAIETAKKERAERCRRTVDDVLLELGKIRADAMQIVTDKSGHQSMLNHAAALKALELEGKHLGMFTDKPKLELNKPEEPPKLIIPLTIPSEILQKIKERSNSAGNISG